MTEPEVVPKIGKSRKRGGNAGKGRVKGVPNKTTALLKDAILKAAELVGNRIDGDADGLVKYLEAQAVSNPGPFLALLGKVLPLQITGADGSKGGVTFTTIYQAKPEPRPIVGNGDSPPLGLVMNGDHHS